MKTDLTTPGSYAQPRPLEKGAKDGLLKNKIPIEKDLKNPSSSPDYKVDLSLKAPSVPVPSAPSAPKPEPSLPKVQDVAKAEARSEVKAEAVKAVRPAVKMGTVKKPTVIFIKGMDVFSSPSKSETGYAGVGRLAESIEGSRIYGWDQKEEIMEEVLKTHPDYPVILVGHSFGGDTALEIADELDSLENKFRSVDLLVTMDAVGFSNDIVPQNVKKHLNVFGENDFFLNDGPHVARRHEKTAVTNILSSLDHTDIDDNKEIQYEVVNLIQKTLSGVS